MAQRPLSTRLRSGETILLDGAVGTELDRRGVSTRLPLWSAHGLTEAPEVVREIHADYARAGADVLIANTFRTTRRTFAKVPTGGVDLESLNRLAVELARDGAATRRREVLVAGSIAPLEDCYSPWLSPPFEVALAEHREQARWLAAAGVDLLMVETMPTVPEAEAAVIAASETGLEVTVSFVIAEDGRLLSGASLTEAVGAVRRLAPVAVLVNCAPAATIVGAIQELKTATTLPIGGYANLGVVEPTVGWSSDPMVDGAAYANAALEWRAHGAQILGGCCGTSPDHIAALRTELDARNGSAT